MSMIADRCFVRQGAKVGKNVETVAGVVHRVIHADDDCGGCSLPFGECVNVLSKMCVEELEF